MQKLSFLISVFSWIFLSSLICQSQDEEPIPKGQVLQAENIERSQFFYEKTGNLNVTTIFIDDFESGNITWDLSGSWQIGEPNLGTGSGYNSPN